MTPTLIGLGPEGHDHGSKLQHVKYMAVFMFIGCVLDIVTSSANIYNYMIIGNIFFKDFMVPFVQDMLKQIY